MNSLTNLLPETGKVLTRLAKLPLLADFTFVGGSALAIYYGHRLSEDIDLFTWHKQINPIAIQEELNSAEFEQVRIVNLSPTQADFIVNGVKLTFFANGWSELQNRTKLFDELYIAQTDTLTVMKVNTLFLRAKYRDYYDLYVLNLEGYTLPKMFELTTQKMKNLSTVLFQRAIVFTGDIDDESIQHLTPKYKVTLQQIENHFSKAVTNWNKELRK